MSQPGPAEHITPYDRIALDEPTMVALLAAPARHEGLVDYFGAELHAELVELARATQRAPAVTGRRIYLLPGIMGSQIGYVRGKDRPHDIVWLDPIDINFGRLMELRLPGNGQMRALGAMSYTYLKLTLSLRKAGFDAVLMSYDWRHDLATLGKALAERIAADGFADVGLIGHSMGGLVARAAMTHAAGSSVSRLVMLGTPNHGSLAAVQALRGTYSVVRKLAQMDLRHDAEFLASHIFSTFAGLHELLPSGEDAGGVDLFVRKNWPAKGPGPDAALLRAARGLPQRLAPADERFHAVVGCNRITATRLFSRNGDFEYEYSLRGDGTVPMELARLAGAKHSYVDCDHSDMPLSDRIIAGTIDLLKTGKTRRFAAAPRIRQHRRTRVRDTELRREYAGKVDWPQMSPAVRRLFLDTLNEPPRRMRGSVSPLKRPRKAVRRRKPARKK
jgi:pimeloyl-ACP methyl ester carboxylesterase